MSWKCFCYWQVCIMKPVFVRMEHVEMFQKFQTGSFNTQSNSMSKSNDELTAKMLENVTQLHKIEIIQLKVHAFHRNWLDCVTHRYITQRTYHNRTTQISKCNLQMQSPNLHHLSQKTEVNDLVWNFWFSKQGVEFEDSLCSSSIFHIL